MSSGSSKHCARPWRRGGIPVLAALLAALTACSSGGPKSDATGATADGGSGTSNSLTGFDPAAALAKGYGGDFTLPPTSGPKAVSGKKIWYISCGQLYVSCANMSTAFKAAGSTLGWNVSIQDSKADGTVASNLIQQAIAARVDGIAVVAFDCPLIKSALLAAKSASIPVATFISSDCNDPAFGSDSATQQPLFAASIKLRGSTRAVDFYDAWARARADYIVAKVGSKAGVLDISEQSQLEQKALGVAFSDRMKATCPGCKLTKVPFTFAQVPNPATQIWQTAIQAHPEATVVTSSNDSLMAIGLQSAIRQSGRSGLVVGGGDGAPPNLDLIRQGSQTFSIALPYSWNTWGLADTLNRLLAGESASSLPEEGGGWQFVDAQHNLPATGTPYEPPVDYKAAYKKVWGVS